MSQKVILRITNPASHGADTAYAVEPGQEVTLGRSNTNHIIVVNPYISREHLRLSWDNDTTYVEDLGSRNGTKLNGQLLRGRSPLVSGDLLEISGVKIQALNDDQFARSSIPDLTQLSATSALSASVGHNGELQTRLFTLHQLQRDRKLRARTRRATFRDPGDVAVQSFGTSVSLVIVTTVAALVVIAAAVFLQ